MASLGIPAYGYGIRYEHGLFRQRFHDGWQVEEPEDWLTSGHVWEFERPEVAYPIKFGGHISFDGHGRTFWHAEETVLAVAYDTPIAGWQGAHVNTLRLWSSKPVEVLDLRRFNHGDYVSAAEKTIRAETISRVLYPDDTTPEGKELRLKQEFFFTSASLQDLVRRFTSEFDDIRQLPDHVAIQMNDTHPAIAVAELMRLLADEHRLPFAEAFEITRKCLSYTNHTLMPEALERWSVQLFRRVLPRHMQIIEWIDYHHLAEVQGRNMPIALDAIRIIEWGNEIKMGNLAFIGSHRVNGVSALHTELMKQTVFADFHTLYPDRIVNETNGITPAAGSMNAIRACAIFCSTPSARAGSAISRRSRRPLRWRRTPPSASASPPPSGPTRSASPPRSRSASASTSIPPPCSTFRSSASTNTSASC